MSFSQLLGNEQLKKNLQVSLQKGRVSHFYLISGPEGSGKKTLARLLAAAILCGAAEKPCMQCNTCRKVMGATHPDFITVVDQEHKYIPVDMVRDIRDDMYIRPNEAEKKIYMFPQELRIEGQNALLKILEEPPSYGVFMLLTDNPEKLLPTVRSRATELRLQGLEQSLLTEELQRQYPQADLQTLEAAAERSGGYLGQALELLQQERTASEQTERFAQSFCEKDPVKLLQTLVPMEKWDRERLMTELSQWLQLLQQALLSRSGMKVSSSLARQLGAQRSSAELLQGVRQLKKTIEYAQGNVSPAAICGYLVWVLR